MYIVGDLGLKQKATADSPVPEAQAGAAEGRRPKKNQEITFYQKKETSRGTFKLSYPKYSVRTIFYAEKPGSATHRSFANSRCLY
jgi:hypothetical protein